MIVASYDQIAAWYDESVRSGTLIHDIVEPALFGLMEKIQGQHICDLACGQGVVARQLARCGAVVTGIDLSEKLLEIAQQEEKQDPLGITYFHDDVQTLSSIGNAVFDGVICTMSLMDIADIEATFRQVQRIVRPGGWFIFAITHPCFQTPRSWWLDDEHGKISRAIQGYFEEGFWRSDNAHGVRGQVEAYHRTLSTYLNTLIEAGFTVKRMIEPRATGRSAERVSGYKEVPAAMIVYSLRSSHFMHNS